MADRCGHVPLGILSSNNADGNENVKKKKLKQKTTLHMHHVSLEISFLFLHD